MIAVDELRAQERAEREAKQRQERERLGLAPLATSVRYACYAAEVAEERLGVALQYAETDGVVNRLDRALRHIQAARTALGRPGAAPAPLVAISTAPRKEDRRTV